MEEDTHQWIDSLPLSLGAVHTNSMEVVVVPAVERKVGRAGLLGLVWYQADDGLNLLYCVVVVVVVVVGAIGIGCCTCKDLKKVSIPILQFTQYKQY